MELVLFYTTRLLVHPAQLRHLLEGLGIPLRVVSPRQLGQTVGFLAGLPDCPERPAEAVKSFAEPVMVFCGFSQERLDQVLNVLRVSGGPAALKAVLTPTNQNWTLARLVRELQSERAEIAKQIEKED